MAHIDAINPSSINNASPAMDVVLQVVIPKVNELIAAHNAAPTESAGTPTTKPPNLNVPVSESPAEPDMRVVSFASEAAQDLAIESGVDPATIEATGATGATKADVQRAIAAAAGGDQAADDSAEN